MNSAISGFAVHGFSLHGAWTRESVSIGGSEAFETQRVYWLQAGPCYADLRVPFHSAAGTSCFSGRSGWDGDRYRWTHQLDMSDRRCDDVGDLVHHGDRLIERGSLGTIAYEEVWMRLPNDGTGRGVGHGDGHGGDDDDRGECEAMEAPHACHVQVGGHAITIVDARPQGGSFNATYRVRTPDGWRIRAVIGDGAAMPAPGSGIHDVGALDLWGVHPPIQRVHPQIQRVRPTRPAHLMGERR